MRLWTAAADETRALVLCLALLVAAVLAYAAMPHTRYWDPNFVVRAAGPDAGGR